MEIMPPLYRCGHCKSEKPLSEFPPSKAQNSGQWCRKCLREDKRRSLGLEATDRTVTCEQCGKVFDTSYAKAMFCSRQCKSDYRHALAAAERANSKPDRNCLHCGTVMSKTMRMDAKFCSSDCNSAAHAITRKMAKRAGRKKRYDDPLLERNYIAKRDNYRCGLCGGKVDMTLRHPDPMFGSIDHIIPVADGGDDELQNLQLAHLRCNLQKRDRGAAQQLRLIG